jgi:hypothetical protein
VQLIYELLFPNSLLKNLGAAYTRGNTIFMVTNNKNIRPILGTLCAIIRRPPIFWMINQEKNSVLYSGKYGILEELHRKKVLLVSTYFKDCKITIYSVMAISMTTMFMTIIL